MAENSMCLCIFNLILIFSPAFTQILHYKDVSSTKFIETDDGFDQTLFVPLQDQVVLRVRRDLILSTTESPAEKPRPTKKSYLFDSKQTTILADGAGNKTGKYNPKVPTFQNDDLIPASPAPATFQPPLSTVSSPMSSSSRPWQKASGPPLVNMTLPADTEIQITRFLNNDISNGTLEEHHIKNQSEDHHVYYNSTLLTSGGQDYWVDIDRMSGVKISDILSTAHRRAVTVKLSFDFPFYGHLIRNMTIATGGFLYTGEYVHAWLAATQYIAPLMANFDTSLSNQSYVKYADNGTSFVVQWENVALQEHPLEGSFTFQCTLHDTGKIVFAYRNVALFIDRIEESQHPVKVGLSDAYIIDRTIFFVRRKTIYEYHRVDFKRGDIRNGTAIILTALDTCHDMKDCVSCVTELPRFQCNWCSGRCSTGMDRHRQDWLQKGCEASVLHTPDSCPISYEPPSAIYNYTPDEDESVSLAGVIGILSGTVVVLCVSIWLLYAYRNPHTPSGQLIIRLAHGKQYRPSTWTWRRGEARYTAATIHM